MIELPDNQNGKVDVDALAALLMSRVESYKTVDEGTSRSGKAYHSVKKLLDSSKNPDAGGKINPQLTSASCDQDADGDDAIATTLAEELGATVFHDGKVDPNTTGAPNDWTTILQAESGYHQLLDDLTLKLESSDEEEKRKGTRVREGTDGNSGVALSTPCWLPSLLSLSLRRPRL